MRETGIMESASVADRKARVQELLNKAGYQGEVTVLFTGDLGVQRLVSLKDRYVRIVPGLWGSLKEIQIGFSGPILSVEEAERYREELEETLALAKALQDLA